MELSDLKCTFVITEKVKQSRVGTHLKPVIEFLAYPENEKLCVIKHLQEYIKKTQVLRSDCSRLLLSHVKPHGPARDLRILLVFYQLPAWFISLQTMETCGLLLTTVLYPES